MTTGWCRSTRRPRSLKSRAGPQSKPCRRAPPPFSLEALLEVLPAFVHLGRRRVMLGDDRPAGLDDDDVVSGSGGAGPQLARDGVPLALEEVEHADVSMAQPFR